MKKQIIIFLSLILLLCSCNNGIPADTDTGITEEVTVVDTGILLSAAGFETVYDENLGATWVYRPEIDSGLFARILVYDDGQTSLRVICTEAPSFDTTDLAGIPAFEYGGGLYVIKDGDEAVNDALMSALQGIANGGACKVGDREITNEERDCLSAVITLYKASYGEPHEIETKSGDVSEEEENGYRIYSCEEFSVKYPNSFSASKENDTLIITSGTKNPRTVSIKHTDTVFSHVIAEEEAVSKTVSEQGGELTSDITKTSVGGNTAYTFSYKKNDMYLSQYYIDGGKGTYIITSGSYEKNDALTGSIISTFRINDKAKG